MVKTVCAVATRGVEGRRRTDEMCNVKLTPEVRKVYIYLGQSVT